MPITEPYVKEGTYRREVLNSSRRCLEISLRYAVDVITEYRQHCE